ncbi:tRNA methyltransferase complex GCD14 subunit [Xylariaceae sp. FL1272]|nr:tRNA methyltransferase complex GCD14 subunit [Xylariaceae sp. FL1272]
MSMISPFLDPGLVTTPNALALVHLSRDNVQPVYLQANSGTVDGYAEGAVVNTRFGSFPHSTLLNQQWGSQIRASIVDTGTRGRKRKLAAAIDTDATGNDTEQPTKELKQAASGFIHILPPTPEMWTASLPHRTQVVYTPDYSYILHRIRARPGMQIIEAGSGSGSFTHASARAVYCGYPKTAEDKRGKVWSFEYNEDRFHKMEKEVLDHNLAGLVQVTHRNVYEDGFLVDGESPGAECIFLDVPAPWQALPHLSRSKPSAALLATGGLQPLKETGSEWKSPLRPDRSVYLCTFSPCIEQVTKTVEIMRRLGWMDIEMVEVAHRKIAVLREKIGLNMPNERGITQTPANVAEAVARLKRVEQNHLESNSRVRNGDVDMDEDESEMDPVPPNGVTEPKDDTEEIVAPSKLSYGKIVHRTEPEIKTHTSYLVFAVLPQEWTAEQEAKAFEAWPCGKEKKIIGSLDKQARKQEKREMLLGKKRKKENNKQKHIPSQKTEAS